MICFALLAGIFIFSGCKKEKPEEPGKATQRYETVPYVKSSQKSGELDNLVFADYDDEYNYYFFVLGYIKSVPLAYRDAYYYDGITNITVKYSRSDITQESIKNSVTKASTNSVTQSHSTNYSNEVGGKVAIGPKWLSFEQSYKDSWGGSDGTSGTNSRSFSNTYETSFSSTSNITSEESYVIGNKGEPAGMYRWSQFSTTDVYFVVVTDRAKTTIIDRYTVFCARPEQYWKLDYDPEEGGSFGKTASGTLLQVPDVNISQLPNIEECQHEWGNWDTLNLTCTTDGERIRTCSLCQKTERETIQTTGHDWGNWELTKEPTGTEEGEETRACTKCSEKQSRSFIIYYTLAESGDTKINGNGGQYFWYHDTKFNIESLKAQGYKTVTINLNYAVKANGNLGGESKVRVYGERVNIISGDLWGSKTTGIGVFDSPTNFRNVTLSIDKPIDDFNNLFTVVFFSTQTFDHTIGGRTVTVTAKK